MVDESFKRPGSIPFQWEIEPGIPKENNDDNNNNFTPLPATPKLSPPPSLLSLSFNSPATTIFSGSSSVLKGCFSFRHVKLKDNKKNGSTLEIFPSSQKLIGGNGDKHPQEKVKDMYCGKKYPTVSSPLQSRINRSPLQTDLEGDLGANRPNSH